MNADASQVDVNGLPISRDPKFFRTIADAVFVVAKGAELELCFVAFGPDPVFQQNDDADVSKFKPGAVRLEASLSDVGHVRLDAAAAANLAINLLSRLLDQDLVTRDDIRINLDELLIDEDKSADQPRGHDDGE